MTSGHGYPLLKALLVWLLLMAGEILHGAVRTLWLAPVIGDVRARQVGVFSGSLIVLVIAILTVRWLGANDTRTLLRIGVSWVLLTLIFELGIGRFVMKYPWHRLAADYNVAKGGLLPFGLAIMGIAPVIARRVRKK